MDHFPHHPAPPRLAGDQDLLAEGEAFAEKGLVEPKRPDVAAAGADQHAQHAAAAAGGSQVDVFDRAANALQLPFFEIVGVALVGHVFVGAGEEEENVADGFDAEPIQGLGPLRTNPFEELHRRE